MARHGSRRRSVGDRRAWSASATLTPVATVLHTMQRWLPLSEQFVHALVTGSSHRAVVLSRLPAENRRTFPHRPVISLGLLPARWPGTSTQRRLITAAVAAVARTSRARVIHQHHGYRLADVEGAVRRLELPLVVSLHGHDVTSYEREWPGSLRTLAYADAVIVPSRFLAERVEPLGVAPERLHVIPSGVDVRRFAPTPLREGPPSALFVGRFVEKKGIDVLLAAWPRVREQVPDARLTLLGSGPLEALARSGGPRVDVELTDPARRADQVRDAIRDARLVVTPSKTAADGDAETLLLVNLEAQASGRPLVTTFHGGIPEYVEDGRTALVVPENDPGKLADAMVRALTDEPLARSLAAAGPELARRYDVAACTARVDELYDSLIR
jgi:glycosyltransferase involved in cell wall biosynthesis